MLKNIRKDDVNLKYNGKIRILKPGEAVDVRDFDVANKDALSVEKHLMMKHPGAFKQEKSVGDPKKDEELTKEFAALQKQNEDLKQELSAVKAVNEELANKHDAAQGEIQSLKETANSLKAETDAALAKVGDFENEIQKLREQIGTGKTAKGKK